MIFKDEEAYCIGEFANDQLNGKATVFFGEGDVYDGIWENN